MPITRGFLGTHAPEVRRDTFFARQTRLLPSLLLLFAMLAPGHVLAQIRVEKDDIPFMPQECMMRYLPDSDIGRHWAMLLKANGGDIGITHYCLGMKGVIDLYRGVPKPQVRSWINTTFNEFKYVEDRWPEDHMLRPSIEIAKGRVRYYERKYDQAAAHFERAIKLNENLVDGYAWLSDALMESGKHEAARAVIKIAVEKFPGNRKIELRRAEQEKSRKK